jgi:primosomal protein N' (replication factor Y)
MASDQQHLFELEPPAWEADDEGEQLVASIVFSTGPEQAFDYTVPENLRGMIAPGQRVMVPFSKGNRQLIGYCVDIKNHPPKLRRLKQLHSLVDERPILGPAILSLARWMADYYLCPLGQVLETVLPAGVRDRAGTRLTTFLSVPTDVAAKLTKLEATDKQVHVLKYLAASPQALTAKQLAAGAKCSTAMIGKLRRMGLVRSESRRVDQNEQIEVAGLRESHFEPNADQSAALETILGLVNSGKHSTVLVHGVTGSGKTEVYMQAIQEVIGFGRQAIVLVPEISLTPQAQQRFRSRFGRVAVLHSHLSDVERHRHWERIASGEVSVVVGARSAVFAPTPNLGLVILDEEHEGSFKQDTAPRYHARDVARERCRHEGVPLVLGSATPSLESWQRTRIGEFQLVSMPRRVFDRPMPAVATIDLRDEFRDRRSRGAISRQLHIAMDVALKDKGQVILLLNRRGYSTHIQCPSCGFVLRCPQCSIALTHHQAEHLAICHSCDHREPLPDACPQCRFPGLRYSGFGTQKLEAEVRARFPDYACLRMDTDTMQRPGSHERALKAFHDGDVRILLGTQMIAKGLDFPNVLLVGVINADIALHLPDFRAAERTFQLVTQVAGRTGRGERGGRVLVQTFSPEHPAIEAAIRHDFDRFATVELPIREALGYPPFAGMVRLVVRGPVEEAAFAFATQIGERLTEAFEAVQLQARILGPAAAPISKLRGLFRFHVQCQSADTPALHQAVRDVTTELKPPDEIQWIVDVDPLDML